MSAEILLLGLGATIGGIAVGLCWLADRWFSRHHPKDET